MKHAGLRLIPFSTFTKFNGVKGYKATSKIPEYTNIWRFLPANGYMNMQYTSLTGTTWYNLTFSHSVDNERYSNHAIDIELAHLALPD